MKELGFSPRECYLILNLVNNTLKNSENHILDEIKHKILSSNIFEISEKISFEREYEMDFKK